MKWNSDWEKNSLQTATVSAWALEKNNVKWKNKIDGAQFEPIGYWGTNNKKGARSVKIYEMQHTKWKISWASIFTLTPVPVHETPSTEHIKKAIGYATKIASENEKNHNHPYNLLTSVVEGVSGIPLQSKWWDNTCYCSQLVWRSWCNAEMTYDFSGLTPLVLPTDIAAATNTKKIASYNNW
ncbi:MAG: hypothetical protein K5681_05265 [Treponema sp.]|nr:hypothetical protein [Treponema sp.]